MDRKSKEVRVRNPAAAGEPPRVFTMDNVFDESQSQQTVYEETCRPIVANIIQGYNGTIFCYGYERKKRGRGDNSGTGWDTVRWLLPSECTAQLNASIFALLSSPAVCSQTGTGKTWT